MIPSAGDTFNGCPIIVPFSPRGRVVHLHWKCDISFWQDDVYDLRALVT